MRNLITYIFVCFILSSCSNENCQKSYYKGGSLKTEICYYNDKQYRVTKEYYKSGGIKTIAKFNKGRIVDTIQGFYENGKKEFIQFKFSNGLDSIYYYRKNNSLLMAKGKIINGRASGWVKYYNKKGNKVISCKELLYIFDEEKPYINQALYYDKEEKLIVDKSSFYEIKIEDTLKINKEYPIHIKYNPSISKESKVFFCYSGKIEDNFKNINYVKLDTLILNNSFNLTTKLTYSSKGNKNLRGFFLEKFKSIEKDNKNDTLVDIKIITNKMYFDIPIYVKENFH